ncbi:glutamate-rich protein 2-like [Halichondria panicea]|uniref:glutamate-rich protein 2-like n=1 Tax=Halichondria panicea TaxID=6063 RepID=UPI00312B65D4
MADRVPSAHSIKSPTREMEMLSPEGSSVYMTEVRLDDTTAPVAGKPLPPDNTTTLIGVPRKVSVPSVDEVDSCSSESPPPSPASVLKNAGVDIDLNTLTPDGSSAPLELLSQFMSCVMREEYEAAQLLCMKLLEFEPNNQTAQEFLPVIMERLKLDAEFSSEESSDSSSSESETDSASSSDHDSSESEATHETVNCIASHTNCTHHH